MDPSLRKYCPSCSQHYYFKYHNASTKSNSKNNVPLLLSCGHSMCENCVTNIVKFAEPIQCRVCQRDSEVSPEELDLLMQKKIELYKLFPINAYMLGEIIIQSLEDTTNTGKISDDIFFVDLKSIMKSSVNKQEQCLECHCPTSKMCKQCATILCNACFTKSHKNFVIFKSHVLQDIEALNEPNNCSIHKQKPLDYYCKECSKSICMDCMIVGGEKSCKNHNVVSMQEVNDTFVEKLGEVTPKVDETFKRLTQTAVDIGHLLLNIENDTGSSSELNNKLAAIEQHFSKLTSIIQKHKKEVVDIIVKIKCSEKESLIKSKTALTEAIRKAKTVLDKIEMLSVPGQTKQINLFTLLEDAKKVVETPWYLSKDESNDDLLKVAVNEDLCALMSDYIHLEGNANSVYKLYSVSEIPKDVEIPPPPKALVYPPELPKDVRQSMKNVDKTPETKPMLFKNVPQYRSKSGSTTSLNSISSDSSRGQHENSHRRIVHPVPPYTENPRPTEPREGCQELVYISHIVDPFNFFVQKSSDQRIVKDMIREFRNAVSMPRPYLTHVAVGKLYLIFNKADNMWQRCRIVSIDNSDSNKAQYHVYCIDFGNTRVTTLDKLRLLPPARVTSPSPLAAHCSLANVQPFTTNWNSEDAVLVQKIIDNKQAVIHIRRVISFNEFGTSLEVDVTTYENGINLAHALVFHERARFFNSKLIYPATPMIMERPKLFSGSNYFKPNSVEEVYITHVVSPDKFYVRKQHLHDLYNKLCEDLEQDYSLGVASGSVYLPEIGMACAVNVDKSNEANAKGTASWCRGVVTELPGRARVRLTLPDTGASVLVHWTMLRHLHHRYTTAAALATECHLAGVTPLKKKWSPSSVALLQQFEDRLLELLVQETRGRGSVGVVLYDKSQDDDVVCVNKQMIKYKFAVSFGLFMFDKVPAVEEQMVTNKSPVTAFTKPKPSKVKPDVTILKRQSTVKEDQLEAKNKGPLRLEAKLLHYQSPSLLYLTMNHQQKLFNELYEKLQKHYTKNQTKGKEEWQVGDRCCTVCIQSGTWRRAVILEIDGQNAKLFYTDFACVETVPIVDLRELTPEFASIGNAAIKCHLCGVIPAVGEEWPTISKEFLKELLDAYRRTFITKLGDFKDNSMPIEIWVYHTIQGGALEPDKSEWRCLNYKIVEQGLGIPDKSLKNTESESQPENAEDDMLAFLNVTGSVKEWLQLEPMPTKPLIINLDSDSDVEPESPIDEIQVDRNNTQFISDWLPPEPLQCKEFTGMPTYIDHNAIIYLHDLTQNETLDLIRKALDVRFKNPDPKAQFTSWKVGEPCVALYYLDNRFYRGRILEVNKEESSCLVHYIDYGNDELCSFENLRKSIALHQIPIQAHKCVLDRIKPVGIQWDRQALDYFHKCIVEKECFVKVAGEPVDGIIPIDLKFNKLWINDHLVEFEMAQYIDGSKATIKMYAPVQKYEETIVNDSDDSPDYFLDNTSSDYTSIDPKEMEGVDWNKLLEDDGPSGRFLTFNKHDSEEFLCNITVLNDRKLFDLNVLHDDETNVLYDEMFEELQRNPEELPALDGVLENKACLAKFSEDEKWYRASIYQYDDENKRVKVRYVDYGNIGVVSINNVREIHEELTKLPPVSIQVKFHGIRVNNDIDIKTVAADLAETFLDKGPFYAKVIAYEDSIPLVELRDDDGRLVYEELLQKGIFEENTD